MLYHVQKAKLYRCRRLLCNVVSVAAADTAARWLPCRTQNQGNVIPVRKVPGNTTTPPRFMQKRVDHHLSLGARQTVRKPWLSGN